MTNRTLLLIPHYNSLDSLYATLASVEAAEKLDLLVVDDGSNQPPEMQRLQQSFVAKGKTMLQLKIRVSRRRSTLVYSGLIKGVTTILPVSMLAMKISVADLNCSRIFSMKILRSA